MINNYQNDLSCEFAETLIGVLYGEATVRERQEFRKHFNSCALCQEELASFGSIREVVAEWRAADFDLVKTPTIVLPDLVKPAVWQNANSSWRERVHKFFFPNNGPLGSLSAFATFGVCALLLTVFGYALIHVFSVREINVVEIPKSARNEPVFNNAAPTPVILTTPSPQVDSKQPVKSSANKVPQPDKSTQTVTKSEIYQNKPVTTTQRSVPKRVKTADKTNLNASKPAELAIEAVDDSEDNSLRLSDLLEDITPSI